MRLVSVTVAVPVIHTHSAMVFLAPILAIASAWRASREPSPSAKATFWILAAWFAVVVAVQIGFAIDPRDPQNRRSFA